MLNNERNPADAGQDVQESDQQKLNSSTTAGTIKGYSIKPVPFYNYVLLYALIKY